MTHIQQTLTRHTNRQTDPLALLMELRMCQALTHVLPAAFAVAAVPVAPIRIVQTWTTNACAATQCSPSPYGHLNLIS